MLLSRPSKISILMLILCTALFAYEKKIEHVSLNRSELWVGVKDTNGLSEYPYPISVALYEVVAGSSGNFVLKYISTGYSTPSSDPSIELEMINDASNAPAESPTFPMRLGEHPYTAEAYCLVLQGLHYIYFTVGTIGDIGFKYHRKVINGNYYWDLTCEYGGRDVSYSIGDFNSCTLTLNNSFNGGHMLINGVQVNVPATFHVLNNSTHSFVSADQSYGEYNYSFSNWSVPGQPASMNYTVSGNSTLTAYFLKMCRLQFQTNGKPFTISTTAYQTDATIYKQETSLFTATASNCSQNGIDYTFLYWKKNDVIVPNNEIYVQDNATYIAYYSGKPNTSARAQYISIPNNQIVINWAIHPSSAVTTYNVYRRAGKTNPTISFIGSTSSLSYTDPDYTATGNMEDEWLSYDARPYYSGEQYISGSVESDPNFQGTTWGLILETKNEDIYSIMASNELPTEFAFGNYPNPFNPETTINYQLPEKSFVTIKVYDILGKEVAELVNENKSAGYYQVKFDGSRLTSGIYVAAIQANKFSKSIKILLTK